MSLQSKSSRAITSGRNKNSENRLYVISAVVSDGDPESKAERFLSSVRFD